MNYNLLVESSARSIDHLIKTKYFTCIIKYTIIIDKLSLNDKWQKKKIVKVNAPNSMHTPNVFINYLMEIKIHKNINCISIRSDFRTHNETAIRIANWETQSRPAKRSFHPYIISLLIRRKRQMRSTRSRIIRFSRQANVCSFRFW